MATKVLIKDPDESKIYDVEFADLLADGETISGTPTVVASPSGLTIGTVSVVGTRVQFSLSAGSSGTLYVLTVTATTSTSSTLEGCVRLLVVNCCLFSEIITMVRHLINDLDDEDYTYSDARLIPLIVVAAGQVIQEVDFATAYTVNVKTMVISPDPSTNGTRDPDFLYFTSMKAACMVDQMTLRTKALSGGVQAVCGPVSISTAGQVGAFKTVLEMGPCKMYDEAVFQYNMTEGRFFKSVLSPFRGPQVDLANHHGAFSDTSWRMR
jgi:hypothetical protein